jgi:hypothetical protein
MTEVKRGVFVHLMAPKPLRLLSKIEQSVVFPTLLCAPVTEIILNGIIKGYKKAAGRYKLMEEDVHKRRLIFSARI